MTTRLGAGLLAALPATALAHVSDAEADAARKTIARPRIDGRRMLSPRDG
ncbi:hypothetical protein [Stakelama saccharophila]|uniref:Uncharacterized protein n=1 Tax=Stakelama saccharophila TaxID=3075605 RepID=A0ABZ0B840_9SPHN|nr:hypothetical protein [Stakelama sp. W311]WNO53412.1 hypothetical protein RPR59_13330 [Stakelama sp. W311]